MAKLTYQKALELSLSLCWKELAKEGHRCKSDLSTSEQLLKYNSKCPLCELYHPICRKCPLGSEVNCANPGEPYYRWLKAKTKKAKKEAAQVIVDILEKELEKL